MHEKQSLAETLRPFLGEALEEFDGLKGTKAKKAECREILLDDLATKMEEAARAFFGISEHMTEISAMLGKWSVNPSDTKKRSIEASVSFDDNPENRLKLSLLDGAGVTLRGLQLDMTVSGEWPFAVSDSPDLEQEHPGQLKFKSEDDEDEGEESFPKAANA